MFPLDIPNIFVKRVCDQLVRSYSSEVPVLGGLGLSGEHVTGATFGTGTSHFLSQGCHITILILFSEEVCK